MRALYVVEWPSSRRTMQAHVRHVRQRKNQETTILIIGLAREQSMIALRAKLRIVSLNLRAECAFVIVGCESPLC